MGRDEQLRELDSLVEGEAPLVVSIHGAPGIGKTTLARAAALRAARIATTLWLEGDHDFITVFDALHDTGDSVRNASHVHAALKVDGCFMVVEPNAADAVEENLNAIGRALYAGSTLLCTPCALKQGRVALGAQAGEVRLRAVLSAAGFARVASAARTPFNMVLAARP